MKKLQKNFLRGGAAAANQYEGAWDEDVFAIGYERVHSWYSPPFATAKAGDDFPFHKPLANGI